MATYELYLWEPEVDLSNQEWNETLKYIDQDDPVTIKTVISEKIYNHFKDKEHTAPHIETFFNCILEILNKSEYQAYFEGVSDWIFEQQGYLNKSPRLVFQDEDTLANATSNEFKRALYEAIEQSGVCAYETMNGYLLPSDSIARKGIFKEIFNTYPALVPQVPRLPVTLGSIPQNVTEMKDMLLAFMQQHPVGSQFEVEKIVKEFDDKKQYYGVSFKRKSENIIHKFKIMLEYIKRDKLFLLELINNSFYIESEYLTEVEKEILKNNKLVLNEVSIESYLFYINFSVEDLNVIYDLFKITKNRMLSELEFNCDENNLFELFLLQLHNFLILFSSVGRGEDLVVLFLNSDNNKEISSNVAFSLLKIYALGDFSEDYVINIKKNLINSQPEVSRENIKKEVEKIVKIANAVKEHVKKECQVLR